MYEEFRELCVTPSDINEHLPTLVAIARTIVSYPIQILELGIRHGVSARAFLYAGTGSYTTVEYTGIDISIPESTTQTLLGWGMYCDCNVDLRQMDIRTMSVNDIDPHDILFIDSLHTADQVRHELTFSEKTRRFIILHDTVTFGTVGEDGGTGIMNPITEFLSQKPQWRIFADYQHNNGLMILERIWT